MYNKVLKDTINTLQHLQKDFPNFDSWVEVEYQLDLNKAVVLVAFPFEDNKNSNYETDSIGSIKVEDVYQFIKKLNTVTKNVVVCDTTEGDYKHKDTLENTLKEFKHHFHSTYGVGRNWVSE